jgi:hypothetical protein
MGDEAPVDEEPLLVSDTHDAWDAIEDGSNRNAAVTVQTLIKEDPDHVISFLAKKGVIKLGDFKVQVGSSRRAHCTGLHCHQWHCFVLAPQARHVDPVFAQTMTPRTLETTMAPAVHRMT